MAPSRASKSTVPSKKSKSKLSTLRLDAFSTGPKHTIPTSTPSPHLSNAIKTVTRPLTSFAKPPTANFNRKGKGKDKALPPSLPKGSNSTVEDAQLWVDKYVPQTEPELAVHKKKVEDVRRWLTEAFEGGVLRKYRRILALTGHAGTGKTTTLRVLAREMGFEIIEWRNSLDDNFSGDGEDYDRESLTKKFQTFLTRASSCRAITLVSSTASSSATPLLSRQIILLEDLPNILHSGTADAFHAALQDYLGTPPNTPLVCVISDAGTRGEDPESDFTGGRAWGKWGKQAINVRSVIPPAIFNSPYFTEIQFNPIASTLLVKALTHLLTTHFSLCIHSRGSTRPTKDLVQMIVESAHGDIRSAVMALQFACVVQLPMGKRKGDIRSVMEIVTRREQSLALFHMLGKVLYNKRKGDPPHTSATVKDREREKELDFKILDPPSLPSHLAEHGRRGSRVDVNMLYADSPIDASLFALYLHHNYTQFCDEVDDCDKVCEWLSWIDASGAESWQAQQNPHQFHILTMGVLHSLPSPVSRRSQKVFKPEFFDVMKKKREAEESIADTEEWLNSAIEREEEGSRRWARDEVVLEIGGVLKALDTCGIGGPPRNHGMFSTMSFLHPSRMTNDSQRMQQLGEGEHAEDSSLGDSSSMSQARRGIAQEQEKEEGGWLESDDIQEF